MGDKTFDSGVRFHDGSPMTAEDVRYSILRFLLQDRPSGPSSMLLEPLLVAPLAVLESEIDDASLLEPPHAVSVMKSAASAPRISVF